MIQGQVGLVRSRAGPRSAPCSRSLRHGYGTFRWFVIVDTCMPEFSYASRGADQRFWTRDRIVLAAIWPLACLFVGVALWIATFAKIDQDKRAAVADAGQHLISQVADYADALSHALEKADQVLELVRFDAVNGTPRLEQAALQGVFSPAQQLNAFILDAQGAVVSASLPGLGADLAQRDFVQFHRSHSADVLRICPPLLEPYEPGASQSVILLTRRTDNANGQFGGVAVISLPLSYFNPSP